MRLSSSMTSFYLILPLSLNCDQSLGIIRCHNRVSASRTCVAPLSGLPDGGLSTLWCSQPFRLFALSTSSIHTSPKNCFGQCHADRHTRTPQFSTGRVEITGYHSRRWPNCERIFFPLFHVEDMEHLRNDFISSAFFSPDRSRGSMSLSRTARWGRPGTCFWSRCSPTSCST